MKEDAPLPTGLYRRGNTSTSESGENLHKRVTPDSEVSGTIKRLFVNLRPTNSPLVESKLAVIRAITQEAPKVDVVLEIDDEYQVIDDLKKMGVSQYRFLKRSKKAPCLWARDIGFWANEGKAFVIPELTTRRNIDFSRMTPVYLKELELFKQALQVDEVVLSKCEFDGGDGLFSDDTVFLGYKSVGDNEKQSIARNTFTRPVVVLGNQELSSPFPHLDSSVVLAANDMVLMNDPVRMYQILKLLSTDELIELERRFLGKILPRESDPFHIQELIQRSKYSMLDIEGIPSYGDDFAELAEQEEEQAHLMRCQLGNERKVIRLPGMSSTIIPFSPVNSIIDTWVETGISNRRIYVPTYGLPRLDEEVLGILQDSGVFSKIIPIEVGWELNLHKGGLRCAVNVLRG